MSVCRLLQCIGGLAILGGIGTIAYAHLAVSPELHRSVDVARRAVNDAATALVVVSQSVEATEALRPPTAELTHRNLAVLKLTIALLEGLPETLRLIPSAGDFLGRATRGASQRCSTGRRIGRQPGQTRPCRGRPHR
jgi:hypothetical protein